MWRLLIVLCVALCVQGDEGDWHEIKTPQGSVRGRKDPAGLYIFSNIPYAIILAGANKFAAPGQAPIWLKALEPSEKGIVCPQVKTGFIDPNKVEMKEDCLVANVYAPITDEKDLPVVVYVHGGAFELGQGNMLSPKTFVKEHNVIVVTFNYRLGVHGFLCLGTDAAPGNAGLKDQVELLRWVKRNIASYGGNPEDVTLAGYSAGSVSVDLLMLAKSAKGLFHKVILESGVSVASIAVQTDPLKNAKEYAQKLNFTDVDDVYALEQFYKNTPLEVLFGSKYTFWSRTDASVNFGPCVERERSTAFLTDTPVNIIKTKNYKKVPILLGFSNLEGLLMIDNFKIWKNKMNEKFSDFLPADLQFKSEDEKEQVAKLIKEFYFADKAVGEDTILSYIDYFSDVLFVYPTLRSVKLHADNDHQEIYLYEYSFAKKDAPFVPHTEVRGAGHCDQTFAIFDAADISEEYSNMSKTMRTLWSNFVRYGKPVPEGSSFPSWPTAGANRSPHMSLNQPLELRGSLLESRARFWDEIYQKYYREPSPPPRPPHTEL